MSTSKILLAILVPLLLISCSEEKKSELQKKPNQELNKNNTQQNFDHIFNAALDGDIKTIKFSVPEVLNVNSQNKEGNSLLMLASFNGHT